MNRILLVAPPRGTLFTTRLENAGSSGVKLPRVFIPPLELATLAALTPPEFEVDIWDEGIRGAIRKRSDLPKCYDLIGITGYVLHKAWALRFAEKAEQWEIPIVIGGPGVSSWPEAAIGKFDSVFVGEAEFTWPQFLKDWTEGNPQPEYRQVQRPNINDSPAPKWSGIDHMSEDYAAGAVQTTRGCPFDCEFCDVIYLFGRQPRHKAVETVLAEITELHNRGMSSVFFCDDNFIGRPSYAKELLRALIPLNNSFERPMRFLTQLTINLACDDEMLELMADANFDEVCVGLESPREASLREANKPQNYRTNMVEDIHKIQSYGILVRGNMIVGFDSDDEKVFDEIHDFVKDAGILNPLINILKAPNGTPTQARFERDGRLVDIDPDICADDLEMFSGSRALTNIIPKQMSRVELLEHTLQLLEKMHSWDVFRHCAKKVITNFKYVPKVKKAPPDPNQTKRIRAAMQTLTPEATALVMDVLADVRRKAPWMMERMAAAMFRFGGNLLGSAALRESLKKQIAAESADDFKLRILRLPTTIPPSFKTEVQKSAFPYTVKRLSAELLDKRDVPEALIRVWKDFFIRWGATFEKIEDYHNEHLRELCDRTVEWGDAGQFKCARGFVRTDGLSTVEMRRLAGEVLSFVERDLRGKQRREVVQLKVG